MPGTTIPNPASATDYHSRININLDPDAFAFFFRGCVAGDRGAAAAITNTFFIKFHAACVAAGVESTWTPTTNDQLITILNRLNFDEPAAARPASTRRTNRRPSKRKQEPAPADSVSGATP